MGVASLSRCDTTVFTLISVKKNQIFKKKGGRFYHNVVTIFSSFMYFGQFVCQLRVLVNVDFFTKPLLVKSRWESITTGHWKPISSNIECLLALYQMQLI